MGQVTDFRALLRKYMEHVLDCEGADFLDAIERYSDDVRFSADEHAELEKIADEVRACRR